MARNEIFRDADHLSLPVPDGTKSGDPVRVGGLNGVCETDEGDGGNTDNYATVWLKGAHEFSVSFAISSIGTAVYIDSSNKLTATETDNSLYGHALTTKTGTDAGPLTVRIAN